MRGFAAVLIVLFMLGMACMASGVFPAHELGLSAPVFAFPPGMDPVQAEGTAQAARATADTLFTARASATQHVLALTAEAQAARTRTAEEELRMREEHAASTAQAQAWIITGWTATADAVRATDDAARTATADMRTATAEVFTMQQTSEISTATAVKIEVQTQKELLDIQQRALMNGVWAVTKWALPVGILGTLLILAYRFLWAKTEFQKIEIGPDGQKTAYIHRRDKTLIEPNLAISAVTSIDHPEELPLENRMTVKAGEQKVAIARAVAKMPPGAVQQLVHPPANNGFAILSSDGVPPSHLFPDPDVMNTVDGDWSET